MVVLSTLAGAQARLRGNSSGFGDLGRGHVAGQWRTGRDCIDDACSRGTPRAYAAVLCLGDHSVRQGTGVGTTLIATVSGPRGHRGAVLTRIFRTRFGFQGQPHRDVRLAI